MKLTNSFKIDKNIQKLVETRLGYIINGHYYDKKTMTPRALMLFPTYGDTTSLSTHRSFVVNTLSSVHRQHDNMVITDTTNTDITYVFTVDIDNLAMGIKLKETEENVEILQNYNYTSTILSTRGSLNTYISQDDNYIYLVSNCSTVRSNLISIDKTSLTPRQLLASQGSASHSGYLQKIFENETYIYIANPVRYGSMVIFRYNKINNTSTNITIAGTAGNLDFSSFISDVKLISDNQVEFYCTHHRSSAELYINKYIIDCSVDLTVSAVTTKRCTITWSDSLSEIEKFISSSSNCFKLINTNINEKEYLSILTYSNTSIIPELSKPKLGITTFLINDLDNSNLIYTDRLVGFSEGTRGYLSYLNNMSLIAASDSTTYFLNFDPDLEKFTISDSITNSPSSIGIDLSGNILICSKNSEIHMYSPYLPIKVEVGFENDNYSFEGIDIDSHIHIDAYNYRGDRVESTLEISIHGNAIFAQNSKKSIIESTGLNGIKQIPIKVSGPGTISLFTKVII